MALATGNLTGQYKMYRVGRGREALHGMTAFRHYPSAHPPFVLLCTHPLSFCAPILCPSALSPLSFRAPPPIVILSEAKNLFSRLKDMVGKILRRCAPQNDRERGKAAPQNDRERGRAAPQNDSLPPLSFRAPPIVILSEAKNLFSCPRDMARKILRRFRSSE